MNLSSCDFAMPQKTFPVLFQFNLLYYLFWARHEMFTFVCFVEMGWFPIQILDKFRFSPNFNISVQIAYPMIFLEEDKAIEVISDIICTRLVC